MPGKERDGWDKLDIILKPMGGLFTGLAIALVGFLGSQYLNQREAAETNVRLYAQLMSSREAADTALRQNMFNSIIGTFLTPTSAGDQQFEQKVLNLELLAYNFHEALDLAPLFKHVHRKIADSKTTKAEQYRDRIERVAAEVASKQIAALEEVGGKLDGTIDFEELRSKPEGIDVIDGELTLRPAGTEESDMTLHKRHFRVRALYPNRERREIRVQLEITTPRKEDTEFVHSVFWLGFFDFPIIDNTRLSHGQRCAVVLRKFQESSAEITLVYFPGSRASLKEKPYYDEVIQDLLRTRKLIDKEKES
jgi:hypothetical protein